MKVNDFFDNLNCFFDDEMLEEVDGQCTLYKKDGVVVEIRIWNPDYDEFMVIGRGGKVQVVNVDEFKEN